MAACPTCDGRGWVKDGSYHGTLCPDCSDPSLAGKVGRRRANRSDAGWYTGKRVGGKGKIQPGGFHHRRGR